jgi:hypothetical protein
LEVKLVVALTFDGSPGKSMLNNLKQKSSQKRVAQPWSLVPEAPAWSCWRNRTRSASGVGCFGEFSMDQGPERAEVWLHSSTANVYAIRNTACVNILVNHSACNFIVWCSGTFTLGRCNRVIDSNYAQIWTEVPEYLAQAELNLDKKGSSCNSC